MAQLLIMTAIIAALAFGAASGGGATTQNASKGINPVQHSE